MADQTDALNVQLAVRFTDADAKRLDELSARINTDKARIMRAAVIGCLPIFEKDPGAVQRGLAGLPLATAEGRESLTLDSETSSAIDRMAQAYAMTRNAVILGMITKGFHAWQNEQLRHKLRNDPKLTLEEAERQIDSLRIASVDDFWRDYNAALKDIAILKAVLDSVTREVPEAKDYYDAMRRVAFLRRQPGATGGGMPFGLTLQEMQEEIADYETYGPDRASWPPKDVRRQAKQAVDRPARKPKKK